MTDQGLANWGKRYNINLYDVKFLQQLVEGYAKEREFYCNGDPHPSVRNKLDKNANAQAWDKTSEASAKLIVTFASRVGFDDVDFGVGLTPCFVKGNDSCIMVPNSEED
jgi:hypothetical protein